MIIAIIVVAVAVIVAARRAYSLISGRQSPCDGCSGCPLYGSKRAMKAIDRGCGMP